MMTFFFDMLSIKCLLLCALMASQTMAEEAVQKGLHMRDIYKALKDGLKVMTEIPKALMSTIDGVLLAL
ncbi:unnamed protein product, partial [Medioppia subpectinata]